MNWLKSSPRISLTIAAAILAGLTPGALWLSSSLLPNLSLDQLSMILVAVNALVFTFFAYSVGGLVDRIHHNLSQDSLTGLYNQKAFFQKVSEHFAIGSRYGDGIAIIMIDIDHFKSVNDTNNHLAGSAVLKQIGQIIKGSLRETDVAGRFGGDEFIICLPRTELEYAAHVAERLRAVTENYQFSYKQTTIHVTASFGVAATACRGELGSVELVELADSRLYLAKESGRNCVVARDVSGFDIQNSA